MRPRIALTPDERAVHRQWSRRTIAALVAATAVLLALTSFRQDPSNGSQTDAYQRTTALPVGTTTGAPAP